MRAEIPAAGGRLRCILRREFESRSHASGHIIASPRQAVLKRAERERAVFEIVAALALVGVLALSFLPSESVDPLRLNMGDMADLAHVVAYAVLAAATLLSVPRQALTMRRGAAAVLVISLLGIAIELLQPFAGRTASIVDFAGNEIGVAMGMALFWAYRQVGRARNARRYPGNGEASLALRRCRDSQEKC
jgi:hypothetical protein